MAESFTVNIKGLEEIEKRLQMLPEKLRRKHIRAALNDGMEPVKAEAIRKAPTGKTGAVYMGGHIIGFDGGPKLKQSIVTKVSVGAKGATGVIGIDYKRVSHGHLVEFGTKPHKITIKVGGKKITLNHPGAKKQPFMRPAYDGKGDDAVKIITGNLAKAVEAEI